MFWAQIDRHKIKVYGKESKLLLKNQMRDDIAFLHNLLSNDIKGLQTGKFNYNLRLTGNGEPIQDFFVYKDDDFFILDTDENPEELASELNKLKLSLKVFFEPLIYQHVIIWGEEAAEFLKNLGFEIPQEFGFTKKDEIYLANNPLRIGQGVYELFGNLESVLSLLKKFEKVKQETLEKLRIKNCIPKIGKELKKGFHPLEANILYAFSFEKGCYVGQEAIARVYFRGRPPRTLSKFQIEKPVEENEKIYLNDKPVGVITSVSPDKTIALGYILRSLFEEGKTFKTDSGEVKIIKECN
ncbi:folate-binding protein [Persephonella sp.]|uniref:CAF17-like 4Fe-4S cluster assembly/insertion protein YgfZ n=1 Tax=Persephonella sp. TaxID=2060922 RepID=UPI0026192241|nr:folate-binding protein [Persephonella sp.]